MRTRRKYYCRYDEDYPRRYRDDSYAVWGIGNLLKIFYQMFIVPIFRLAKHNLMLHSKIPKRKVVFDCIFMSLLLGIFGVIGWWHGFAGLFALLFVPFFIGTTIKIIVKKRNKFQQAVEESKEITPVKSITRKSMRKKEGITTPTEGSKTVEFPDFDPNDPIAFNAWICRNPKVEIHARR